MGSRAAAAKRAPKAEGASTASVAAYQALRRDIILGVLTPDERLRINDIVERYGCGPIPAREALNRLSVEALVIHSEQRGFAVAPISKEDLIDLTKARSWVAEVALREAVLHGDDAWEERVLLSFHRLSKVPRYLSLDPPVPNGNYDLTHREFHSALFSGCESRWMIELCAKLFDYAERYRNLSRRAVVMPREDEHKAIVDAVLARQVDTAVRLMKEHVELTARLLDDGASPKARTGTR
jgi:DNA-binding GntR family transcriptional regulator